MNTDDLCVVLIIICLVLLHKIINTNLDGLVSKPSKDDVKKMTSSLLNRKELFNVSNAKLDRAKSHFSWIDAVTYEDLLKLKKTKRFDSENISNILK